MADELDFRQAHQVAQWNYERPLVSCRFDPTGKYLFCGGEDSRLARFLVDDGSAASFEGGHESWIFALGFSRDGSLVVSGGGDGRLAWWDAEAPSANPLRRVEAHQGWIRSLAVSPDGEIVATGGNDLAVRLWSMQDGTLLRELTGHTRHVYCVRFHPSGQWVLSGDLIGTLCQWETASGQLVRQVRDEALHSYNGGQRVDFGGIRGIDVSPDGKYLAAGGLHKASNPLGAVHEPLVQLRRWEDLSFVKSQTADGIAHGVIWRLTYLADGTLMGVSGGQDGGYLLFWNADGEQDVHRLKLQNTARDMDLHPTGLLVATAHHDRHARLTRLGA